MTSGGWKIDGESDEHKDSEISVFLWSSFPVFSRPKLMHFLRLRQYYSISLKKRYDSCSDWRVRFLYVISSNGNSVFPCALQAMMAFPIIFAKSRFYQSSLLLFGSWLSKLITLGHWLGCCNCKGPRNDSESLSCLESNMGTGEMIRRAFLSFNINTGAGPNQITSAGQKLV